MQEPQIILTQEVVSRIVELLISYKEYSVIDTTDILVPLLQSYPTLAHLELTENQKLFKVYRPKDWAVALERQTKLRVASDNRRVASLAHKEAVEKVVAALTELSGDKEAASLLVEKMISNRKGTEAMVVKVAGLIPIEVEAFYDTKGGVSL